MKKLTIILLLFLFNCSTYPWKDGNIYYSIEEGFSFKEIKIIEKAMRKWEACGYIKFIPTKNKKEYYKIIKKESIGTIGGSSTIGYSSESYMLLYQVTPLIILHELGHCLGLQHEHQRHDRNDYIKVHWKNIYISNFNNFFFIYDGLIDIKKYKYDYKSIMHYNSLSFSKNNKTTMSPIDSKYILEDLGGRELTETDCLKIRDIYKDTNK